MKLDFGKANPPNAIAIHCMYDGLECLIFRQIIDGGDAKNWPKIPKFWWSTF
jgi:hypothetical protein